jgi:hypothetical protein
VKRLHPSLVKNVLMFQPFDRSWCGSPRLVSSACFPTFPAAHLLAPVWLRLFGIPEHTFFYGLQAARRRRLPLGILSLESVQAH